jgi:regulator of protease activity HflC (stomatin/prohibitin superfamily)
MLFSNFIKFEKCDKLDYMNKKQQEKLMKTIFLIFILFLLAKMVFRVLPQIIIFITFLVLFFFVISKIKKLKKFSYNASSEHSDRDYIDLDSMGGKIKNMVNFEFKKKIVASAIGLVVVILLLATMVVIIPAGETGVYHLFGKVRDNELRSGLHLINPFARITKMSIRTEEYTMSIVQGEGEIKGDDSIKALTKEGLNIGLDLTVLYHLEEEKASDVYRDIGINFDQKIIRPEIRASIREIVATYNAVDIYAEKRNELTQEIQNKLEQVINPRGIIVESVLLRNVTLPAGLTRSIEEKLQADQDAQQMDFVLDKETKEAERKRIQAAGQRDAQKIINESLTDKYLEYLYINELKEREGTIYVPINPSSGMPMFKGL